MRRVLIKQDELMREKAYHKTKAERDPLTSLFNRYFLSDYFERCQARHRADQTMYEIKKHGVAYV